MRRNDIRHSTGPLVANADEVQPRRRRGRPRTGDLAALEARLLLVSSKLFFSLGYGQTTMTAVARAARVSKTTLYARFPSKAALLQGIVKAQIDRWDTGADRVPRAEYESLTENLLGYGDTVLRAAVAPDFVQLNRLMHAESGRFPELGEISRARFKRGVSYLEERIRMFADRDGVPCRDPSATAELFILMISGWTSHALLTNREVTPEIRQEWLEKAVQAFVFGRAGW